MTFRIGETQLQANQLNTTVNPKVDRTFSTFLDEALQTKPAKESIKISHHAQKRLDERGLHLEKADMKALETAFEELGQKGSKDSLIFYKDMALIASIHNRTIITAQNRNEIKMITNIDSAMQL